MHGDAQGGVETALRVCQLLRAFPSPSDVLRISELSRRTGLHKATVSRLILTLVKGGLIERAGRSGYRSLVTIKAQRKVTIGYASQTESSFFAHEVTASLRAAAGAADVDLLILDNCYDPKTTLLNADRFIADRVDVVIEFQTFESIAQLIGSKLQQARIPYVSVDMPSPGSTYFGANNYYAGRLAGRALARWARDRWQGEVDHVVLLELSAAGPLTQLRSSGALIGIREMIPGIADSQVTHLDGANTFEGALHAVRQALRNLTARRILVAANNDPNALGALTAFSEAGRYEQCAVTGQGATQDARLELRRPETRLIGTVAYYPERYGKALLRIAMDLLARKPTPSAIYTRHRLVTRDNVNRLYPGDLAAPELTA